MSNLDDYLKKRGITDEDMKRARKRTEDGIRAYTLREARKSAHLTQVELAAQMGVSQNRISRIESGDMDAMSIDSLRRYIAALGGTLTLTADMPYGKIKL